MEVSQLVFFLLGSLILMTYLTEIWLYPFWYLNGQGMYFDLSEMIFKMRNIFNSSIKSFIT